jgi:hypothetical protein
MSLVNDFIDGAVDSALGEILKKTAGTGKRVRRRRHTNAASRTLRQIEKLLKPQGDNQAGSALRARAPKPHRRAY